MNNNQNNRRRRRAPGNNGVVHVQLVPAGQQRVTNFANRRPVRKFKLLAKQAMPISAPKCAPISSRIPTFIEITGWSTRNRARPLEFQCAIMMHHFVELIMKSPSDSISFDLQQSLGTVKYWVDTLDLDGLFLADKQRALNIIMWVTRFRLAVAHKWIRRIVKYEHVYYSAVALLASPDMVNDPFTAAEAAAALQNLNLAPLLVLPA